jgi:aspartyl-tRNA(Asn)/glutamyl-tRNA(Gln) amidotransferase subunit B
MKHAKTIANIIINDLMKHANENKCKVTDFGLKPSDLAWLGSLIDEEILSSSKVSEVINYYVKNGGDIKKIIGELDLWPKYDNKLEGMVEQIIIDNPQIIRQIKSGKHKAIGSLIGKLKQIDKSMDSKEAMEILKEKLL